MKPYYQDNAVTSDFGDECKARFQGIDLNGRGKDFAAMLNHSGKKRSFHISTVKTLKAFSRCQSCTAAWSLALVQLTKP